MSISYRKRGKKKTWDYRIFNNEGKLVASKSGFKTKREASQEALKHELRLQSGAVIDQNTSLYDLWKIWYELQVLPHQYSKGTLEHHLQRSRKIYDYFKDKPATSIKASDYQKFINTYAKTTGKETMARLHSEVRKVIEFAKRDKLSIDDFTKGAIITGNFGRKVKTEKAITSTKNYHILLEQLLENILQHLTLIDILLYLQLKTGLRFGEVVGLTWDCLLEESLELHTYRRFDPRASEWRPPKTKTSVRKIPIDRKTVNLLKELKHKQEDDLQHMAIKNPDNHIFYDGFSGVPTNSKVNLHLRQVVEALQIQPLDLSSTGLRHTYASIMLAKDIDIWVVAKNMGHKDITQITKTYGHLIEEKREMENNRIREILSLN